MSRGWIAVAVLVPHTVAAAPSDHLAQGTRLFELQQYDAAIAEFEAGYLVDPRADYLYAIGQAYRLKGDCARALRSYTAVLRAPDGAHLGAATRQNIERCRTQRTAPSAPVTTPVPGPVLITGSPPRDPRPAPNVRAWALVLGGTVLAASGAVAWKLGRDDAQQSHEADTYDSWLSGHRAAEGSVLQQRLGLVALGVGTAAAIAGVIDHVWTTPRLDVRPTASGAAATMSFTF